MSDETLSVKEASEYLGIKQKSIYVYICLGFMPATKVIDEQGKSNWAFKKSQLDIWQESRESKSPIKKLMNVQMAAKYSGLSQSTVLSDTHIGQLKGYRLGNIWVYTIKDVQKWMLSRYKANNKKI